MPTELGRIAGYHAGRWDSEGRSCARSGKAVRPALTLACARAVGGEGGLGARRVVAADLEETTDVLTATNAFNEPDGEQRLLLPSSLDL